jgi:hypothetical protein
MKRKLTREYDCGKSCGGFFYFLGIVGAAIYYIQQANGFWQGALGILKAIVWPAFLVYKLFGGA